MKIILVVHGYPPELRGGTENTTQALARSLTSRGHAVAVVAGSMEWGGEFRRATSQDTDPVTGVSFDVHRIHRIDPYFDHWQKAEQPLVGREFELILDEFQPDIVHVQHWIRLSNDLVYRAALHGVPSVVTVNDLWTSCLVAFRVRHDNVFCQLPMAPEHCLDCAGHSPPRPVWQTVEQGAQAIASFRHNALRELDLARAVIAPSRVHAEALGHWLEVEAKEMAKRLVVVAPARPSQRRLNTPKPASERLVLCHFGYWSEMKGTDLIFEALGLTRDPSRFELLLAGGAPFPQFGERVKAMVAACGAKVQVLGAYDPAELQSHEVARASLYLSASRAHESFGLVVDEALELSQGVIVPGFGAFGERASQVEWAVTFESGNARDLARLLDELVDDPVQVAELCTAAQWALDTNDRTARATKPDRHVSLTLATYQHAIDQAAPSVPPLDPDHEAKCLAALAAWDHGLSTADPKAMGNQVDP